MSERETAIIKWADGLYEHDVESLEEAVDRFFDGLPPDCEVECTREEAAAAFRAVVGDAPLCRMPGRRIP